LSSKLPFKSGSLNLIEEVKLEVIDEPEDLEKATDDAFKMLAKILQ
jgi:hypothetical protein